MAGLYGAQVPCKWCGVPTYMLGTRECDGCHELNVRIRMDPEMAEHMLNELKKQQ